MLILGRIAVCGSCVLLLVACDGPTEAREGSTVADSAGVRIVTHPGDVATPPLNVALDAGRTLPGDTDLPAFRIASVLKQANGGYVVADGGNLRVLFLDEEGAVIGSVGREGDGPGEFRDVSVVGRGVADSLLVWDRRLRRLSVLTPGGTFVRSFALQTTDSVPFASVAGVYGDGSLLATGFAEVGDTGPSDGRQVYSSPLYHFGPKGEFRSQAGSFPGTESYYVVYPDGGFSVFPVLFPRVSFRLPVGDRLLFATSDRYELEFMRPDGTLEMILRRDAPNVPIGSEARRVATERLLASVRAGDEDETRAVLERMEVPEHLPHLGDVFGDRLGRTWVREYRLEEAPTAEWIVFDESGLVVGSVGLPSNFSPRDAGADYVVGVVTDELGVESVVEYHIGAEAGAPSG
jgi:hypothetical protein